MHSRSSLAASALALAGLSYGAPAGSSSSSIDKATEFALTVCPSRIYGLKLIVINMDCIVWLPAVSLPKCLSFDSW